MKFKSLLFLVLSAAVFTMFGCGGGGNGDLVSIIDQPTLVIVKMSTTGTLPTGITIGGIIATVSATPSKGLTITAADVSLTGAGVGSLNASNTTNVAAVIVGLINTSGIQTGEFATLQYHVAPGTFPNAGDFSVALTGSVIDTPGADIPGIGVAISVTVQ